MAAEDEEGDEAGGATADGVAGGRPDAEGSGASEAAIAEHAARLGGGRARRTLTRRPRRTGSTNAENGDESESQKLNPVLLFLFVSTAFLSLYTAKKTYQRWWESSSEARIVGDRRRE